MYHIYTLHDNDTDLVTSQNENKRLRIQSDWSWWVSGSPGTTQHSLWSRVLVRQLNRGVAQRAQVTMFLREAEGRSWSRYWPRTIPFDGVVVRGREYGGGSGHVGDHGADWPGRLEVPL